MPYLDIVFDGPPGPESGRFVEVETEAGRSVRLGEWVQREDGYWCIRASLDDFTRTLACPRCNAAAIDTAGGCRDPECPSV